MTIHQILRDNDYFIFSIPHLEVMEKLGREYPIHIKRNPVPYSRVWKEPLFLDFGPEDNPTHQTVPDLSICTGYIFFSERAHKTLGAALEQDGEFLPVAYEGGTGYLFNPLIVAEEYDARDEKITTFNEFNEVQSIGFIEENLPAGTKVFRSTSDDYLRIYCTDQFKQAVEDAKLTGVHFQPDLANAFGGTPSTTH